MTFAKNQRSTERRSKLFRLTNDNIDSWLLAGGWHSQKHFNDTMGINAEILCNAYVDTCDEFPEGDEQVFAKGRQDLGKEIQVSLVSIIHNRITLPVISGIQEDENHVWVLSDEYMNAIT